MKPTNADEPVTGLPTYGIRNGRKVLYTIRRENCPGCKGQISLIQEVGPDADGNCVYVGEARLVLPHCATCHSNNHNACRGCGKCLPDSFPGFHRWRGGCRSDKRYCSNACRQRAYRRRESASD